jgi:hypothetical protein
MKKARAEACAKKEKASRMARRIIQQKDYTEIVTEKRAMGSRIL